VMPSPRSSACASTASTNPSPTTRGRRPYHGAVDRDRDAVADILRRRLPAALTDTNVVAAYLFGSYARGTPTPSSDIDLAVYLGGTPSSLDELLDLARRVRSATGFEIDLAVLEDARLRLVHRILRDGVLVYSDDESARVKGEVRLRKLSGDYAIHADFMDRALLEATAHGDR
jgi:uncharacterized protein